MPQESHSHAKDACHGHDRCRARLRITESFQSLNWSITAASNEQVKKSLCKARLRQAAGTRRKLVSIQCWVLRRTRRRRLPPCVIRLWGIVGLGVILGLVVVVDDHEFVGSFNGEGQASKSDGEEERRKEDVLAVRAVDGRRDWTDEDEDDAADGDSSCSTSIVVGRDGGDEWPGGQEQRLLQWNLSHDLITGRRDTDTEKVYIQVQ